MNDNKFHTELLKLSFVSAIDSGDLEASLQAITETMAEALDVPRASVWFYDADNLSISCANLFVSANREHSSGTRLFEKDFPAYFKYLSEERTLPAEDARTNPATFEFATVYCEPLDIFSMLDAPIRVNGKMVGAICCEQTGSKRHWNISEINFVGNIADIIARALQSKERADALKKLETMNFQLGQLVEARTAELEEQRARSANASKMAVLGEMAGSIAHEINNPLAIIMSSTNRLKKLHAGNKLSPQQLEETINDIEETTLRIEKIIKGLRFFARDGGKDQFSNVSVSQIMGDTLALCAEKLRINGCQVEMKLDDPNLMLHCQPVSISQALLNLLSNSSDAISGLKEKWIKIEWSSSGERLEVRVTDSGPGIPKELREKIMLPFFTTKPIGKGTGLGLGIVRGIIEQHKGEIFLDETSANTSFVLKFPKLI